MSVNSSSPTLSVILHNIRSAQNVGSVFRTADAVGVGKIYLTGYTPAPLDRFGRADGKIAKTALGAEQVIAWESCKSASALIKRLKKEGVRVVAVEQARSAVSYTKWQPKFPTALILGNEVLGVSSALLRVCDEIVEIPMRGKKESLNVSVAAGIILFKASESLTRDR
ncbi:MAG: RNA methyltransferase [Patescibacteria group bacterium]